MILTATAGGASYLWSPGGDTNRAITVSPGSTTAYSITISDTNGCTSTATQTVTINPAATVEAGVDQSTAATATLNGSMGGGATSAIWSTSGTGAFDNSNSLNAAYTPSTADFSAHSVTLTLTTDDPSGPCAAVSDSLALALNRAPTVGSDTLARLGGTSPVKVAVATLLANDADADQDLLILTSVANSAAGASVTLSGDWIFYSPSSAINVNDTFTYSVSDGHGGSTSAVVNVNIALDDSAQSLNMLPSTGTPGSGNYTVHFAGILGFTYTVQWAPAVNGIWTTLGTATADSITGRGSYTDPVDHGTAYYRTIYP